jgi:magnesium-transporting ATPase (P-type)
MSVIPTSQPPVLKQLVMDVALAVNEESFHYLKKRHATQILLEKVKIFSRMKPLDKEAIVRMHLKAGIITGAFFYADDLHIPGMCGDGANDWAALRSPLWSCFK